MRSISLSDYRAAVARTIESVLLRPSMYYRKFSDLESMFHGHWTAYDEIAGLDRAVSFNWSFMKWLEVKKRQSTCSGWAKAIARYAAKKRTDPERVFRKWIKEFSSTWETTPAGSANRRPAKSVLGDGQKAKREKTRTEAAG
jgi:hypothetical protein